MSKPPADAPPLNPLAAPVLMAIVFLNMCGSGLVIPLLPFYAKVFQADAWQVTMMFSGFAAGQFCGELLWGRLSDRIGRKAIIIGTLAACAACHAVLAFAPSMAVAVAARTIAGFFSGNTSTIQSYIIDATPKDRVAARLGQVGSVFSTGFIIGPTLGGVLAHPGLGAAGFRPPLLVAAGLCVVAAIATLLVVREIPRQGAPGARPGPLAGLRNVATDPVLRQLICTTLLSFGGFSAMWSTFGLWGAARFAWGPKEIGAAMALIGVVSSLSQGLLAGWATRRLGESRTVIVALLLAAAFMAIGAAGPPEWLAVPVVLLFVASHTLAQPANLALISRAASPGAQGGTLGANNATSAAARVVGPLVAGFAFSTAGASSPFALAACALVPAALMAGRAAQALDRRAREAG